MIHKCIALVVPARLSEEVTAGILDVRHGTLQALYGPLDCIVCGDWQVYVRADSSSGLRPNVRATQLLHETGLYLPEVAGNALYLGRTDHGWDTDAPAHLIRLAERLFDTRLATAELV
ncbi:hypothetical protein [Arthrobacter sp. Soil762]|uniref:hypothetical protein n=1 Tax=Arthrobacter sp. Soil762 TaxID=1736401 RepID=UPI000701AB75|nr:hypothetical protein [Arthrobacter sp. Soil762]KRE76276.1 hypothetical protein ASG77_20025 [Arthrobacter sp. Soil762]